MFIILPARPYPALTGEGGSALVVNELVLSNAEGVEPIEGEKVYT